VQQSVFEIHRTIGCRRQQEAGDAGTVQPGELK